MMISLQRALRTAAWKLTLARAATAACVVVAVAAGAWTVVALAAGGGGAAFAVVAGLALVAVAAGAWRSRSSALEAARRVEQVAGWQEKLSTAVELDESQSENVFRERLVAEARALLERHSPAALIPWDLQRPAVVAGVLVVVAGVVSAIFPSGLRFGGGELTPERRLAAERIEEAMTRMERAPAGFADLRARIAGVLGDVRANRPAEEVRRGIDGAVDELDRRALEPLRDAATRAADALAGSPDLRDLADAIRRLDASGVRAAGEKTASQLTSMTDARRQGASSSLASGAERSESPGMSAPMWEMQRALDARDVEKFAKAVEILAAHVESGGGDVESGGVDVDAARQSLVDARAALGGG